MKGWGHLLLCLLLSFGIWLMYNLSQPYSGLVSVPVTAQSNLKGRSQTSTVPTTIVANCKATGYTLLRLNSSSRRPVRVQFDPSDLQFVGSDEFAISAAALNKYVSAVFGDGVSLENLASEDVRFRFSVENNKTVPVRAVRTVSFKPQYMALHDMEMVPDSVVIYGEPSRLESIDAVMTKPLNLGELGASVHGVARLERISGVRMSVEQVGYELDVTRYVEVSTTARINARNVPAGHTLAILPSSATVLFRCVFPVSKDPSQTVELYVDYREFASSMTGNCIVHCDHVPEGVIDYTIDPVVCECLENLKQ